MAWSFAGGKPRQGARFIVSPHRLAACAPAKSLPVQAGACLPAGMSSSVMRGLRRGLQLLATGSLLATAAAAQDRPTNVPPGAIVQPLTRDDGSELRGYLTALAENPRSVDAMVGAGRAAMRMGDVEAALTFFGRADGLSPRDARVKAGMAAGLLQMGQPQAALSLFAEAVALGAPEVEIAGDRGLAYDLVGDPRRAQQDYLVALRRRDDPEVKRRMALSLAISGRRDAALRLIDDQLRANDRAGWRTQAFVLALTGDAAGAGRTAQGVMLPGQAEAMAPFLARLAALNPAQKAMAVHLGRFPAGGQAMGGPVAADTSADPGAVALAMGGAPPAAAAAARDTRTTSTRRRADRGRGSADRSEFAAPRTERRSRRSERPVPPAPAPPAAIATQVADAGGRWSDVPGVVPARQSPPQAQSTPARPRQQAPVQSAQPQAQPPLQTPRPQSVEQATAEATRTAAPFSPPAQRPAAGPATNRTAASVRRVELPPSEPAAEPARADADRAGAAEPAPGFSLSPAPAPAQAEGSAPAPAREPRTALADIAELVRTLPPEAETRRTSPFQAPPPRPAPTSETAQAPAARSARARPAPPAHPSRHWVQIAGGANRAALPREFARLREQAPEQLGRRTAFTAELRATNRLLVGPFATARAAQEFVNQLATRDVAAFAWTSEAGEAIERLQAR
jgi:Flp pilus assembly protein TadD